MILKFLYDLNEKGKRVITGLVENDLEEIYDPLREYPMVLESTYKLQEGENIISNYGQQYYGVFSDGDTYKYVNVNDYMLKVKLNASENVVFASTLSKDMLGAILYHLNMLGEEMDIDYIDSGLSLGKNREFSDIYDGWFRKVTDDVYCMLNYPNHKEPMYVGKDHDEYVLTDDFEKAIRIYKKEVRNLLLTHSYIDSDLSKKDVSFSHFNIFFNGKSYIFGGLNSFMVTYDSEELKITRNVKPTKEFRLINDEERSGIIRNMCYLFKASYLNKKSYLKFNGKYLCETDKLTYRITDNAAFATPIDLRIIDILKQAFYLYSTDAQFEVLPEVQRYFVYENQNEYKISTEIMEGKSRSITVEEYNRFTEAFSKNEKKDFVLMSNNRYIKMTKSDMYSFTISYELSGFDATLFTLSQAEALSKVLGSYFMKKEISYIFGANDIYHISNDNPYHSIEEAYTDFEAALSKIRIKFNQFPQFSNLRTESDKTAIEYLRILYPQSVGDSYSLFKMVLSNSSYVNNILMVGCEATCDLIGLSLAAQELNKEVHVTTLEPQKWGFYPNCRISSLVHYDGSIRMSFTALPKEILEKFDMIYLGKHIRDEYEALNDYLTKMKTLDKQIVMTHSYLRGIVETKDYYNQIMKPLASIVRVPFGTSNDAFGNINADYSLEEATYDKPIISQAISKWSIVKIKHHEFVSLIHKK